MGMMMLMDGLESGRLPRVVETHQLLLAKELPDVTVDGAQRQSGTVELAAFVDFRCTQWTSRLTDDLFYGLELSCLSHGWALQGPRRRVRASPAWRVPSRSGSLRCRP